MRKSSGMRRQQRIEALTGYAFVIPQLIGFVLLVLIPLINVFIYSFHNKNMLYGTNIFIGFDNYIKLFENDPLFWKTLGEYTVEELDVAGKETHAGRLPKKVLVLFKEPSDGISPELLAFKDSYSKKYTDIPSRIFTDMKTSLRQCAPAKNCSP